ncbi:hypothetical protein EDL99_03910 [Ornithobacterium rhinotracheale]|uniref:T9SS type B sorting domain-containing protein n=1 Tax=Ornithobacterium rhinotracheale TaxID=28251 RepID=UPI00129D125E|nr:T9SS type B sorting domain-containing protein [Ornithobacterium rhinotracheale]MRJ08034.1 hypothetical protein [Ornithobacterium rhinotracheale]UOH78459.1 T9SS type B sorting domain-containing protein [Ornithobacterium rhinotracheale]
MKVKGLGFLLCFYFMWGYGQNCLSLEVESDNAYLKNNQWVIDDCGSGCKDLKAIYTPMYNTNTYEVKPGKYAEINIEKDTRIAVLPDRYSKKVKLPFKFELYGEVKDEIVFGENGVISFDPKWEEQYCPQFPSQKINASDKGSLLTHTIFGAMQDLSFPESNSKSGIYYRVEGKFPCRKFVVTYFEAYQFGCEQTSTFQIILEELTNKIYINIKNKPQQCGVAGKKTALGIRGAGRTEGIAPRGRDTGVWSAKEEAWVFMPSGKETSEVKWKLEDKQYDGKLLKICKDKALPKHFITSVVYKIGGKEYYKNERKINISIDNKIPILKQKAIEKSFCFTEKKTNLMDLAKGFLHNDVSNFDIAFYERSNYTAQINNPENYTLSGDKKLYVKIVNKTNSDCFQTAVLTIKHAKMEMKSTNITLSNTSNTTKDNFALVYLKNLIFKYIDFKIKIEYFESKDDAKSGRNAIRNVEMKDGERKTIWAKLTLNDACENVEPYAINLIMKPSLKVNDIDQALQLPKLCDNGNDGKENYDILSFMRAEAAEVKTNASDKIVGVYSNFVNAKYGNGPLNRIDKDIIENNKGYLYVKVQSVDGRVGIAKVRVKANFSQVEIDKNYTKNIHFNDSMVNSSYTLDLNAIKNQLIKDSKYQERELEIKYYDNASNANSGNDNVIATTAHVKYKSVQDFSQTYYIRFQLKSQECYTVTNVRVNFYNPRIEKKEIYACASQADRELVTFADYTNEIMGGENKTKKYQISYIFNGTEITQKTFSINQPETIQVKVSQTINNEKFSNIYPVKFILSRPPQVKEKTDIVIKEKQCFNAFYDEDGNEVIGAEIAFDEAFKKKITSNLSNVEFEFYKKYENGNLSEPITDGSVFAEAKHTLLYAKVTDSKSGCFAISKLDVAVEFFPKVVLDRSQNIKIESCTPDGSGGIFNYDDIQEKLFKRAEHPDWKVQYFLSKNEAINNEYPEQNTIGVKFQDPIKTVYARVENPHGCFAIAEADLYSFYPPKLEAGKVYELCDSNFDQKMKIDLEKLKTLIFADDNETGVIFHFYTSQADLDSKNNEIMPENEFSVRNLPSTIFVRSERKGLPCYSEQTIAVEFKQFTTLETKTLRECEGEKDLAIFNLKENQLPNSTYKFFRTMDDLQNDTNPIANIEAFESPNAEVFAKVQSGEDCPALQKFILAVNKRPEFSFDEVTFCVGGETEIVPNIENETSGLTFKWFNPKSEVIGESKTISGINEIGTYALEITNANGCSTKVSFEVKNSPKPEITKITVENDKIIISTADSEFAIEYSADGVNWQDSNIFEKQEKGRRMVYARYKKYGCAVSKEALVLDLYNVITPNGDGKNDVWEVKDLNVFGNQDAKLRIFDRNGFLIYEQRGHSQLKWDGKKNGQKLPSTDYYYILDLPDGRTYKGNITVKNY